MDGVNISNTNVASIRGISGFHLKVIAVISMFIDHFAAVVLWQMMDNTVWPAYQYMRLIGRIAFPIYCFLLVEGFLHTKNVKKYALRLGIFSVISEVPFDLAFNGRWLERFYNNVFFTLLIGLFVIWGISYVEKAFGQWGEKYGNSILGSIWLLALCLLMTGIGGYLAEDILRTDYGAAGVVTIVIMYLLRKNPWKAFLLAVLVLTLMTNSSELVALIGAVFVCYYNGERGKNIKYFFYAFYPLHLLLLWLLTVILPL